MKDEKECEWLVNLLNSELFKHSGCKSDFERVAGASENNKDFRRWIDLLIERECVVFSCVKNGVDTYVVDRKKLMDFLRKNRFYENMKRFILNQETALGFGI